MVSSYEGEFHFPMSTTNLDDVYEVVHSQTDTMFGSAVPGERTRIVELICDDCDRNYHRLAGKTFYIDFQINDEEN